MSLKGKRKGSVRSECEKFSLEAFGQFVKGPCICISGHEWKSLVDVVLSIYEYANSVVYGHDCLNEL